VTNCPSKLPPYYLAMSLLREVKPRNARTARIVKAREPQAVESRKRVLFLHGTKCPLPVKLTLKTLSTLTKPHSVQLNKKNENVHPFEDPASLEFLALKNDCGVVVFGTHSKKRPNNITLMRIFDGRTLDMVELLLITAPTDLEADNNLQIGIEMKPMILFAGSQWEDTSASDQATVYRTMRSLFLDLFQGEEIPSVDVAGLQYVLMIAAGESASSTNVDDPASKPVIHLRWYRVKTVRSTSPKIPRVELEPVGPTFDFRVSRFREADPSIMKEAMKHGRRPNEPKSKKNIEMDLVGDKIGRVHLGKQDLSQLQTRKMKGLKRSHADLEDEAVNGEVEEDIVSEDEDMENGGMELDDEEKGGSSIGASGDEISIGEDSDEEMVEQEDNELPKRQKLS
jgi:ribosome production factor 2